MSIRYWSSDVCSSDLTRQAMVPSKSKPRRHRVLLQHTAPYPILIPWLRLPSVPADASTATIDGIPPCRPALRGAGPVQRIADIALLRLRTDERRVGHEWVGKGGSRGWA